MSEKLPEGCPKTIWVSASGSGAIYWGNGDAPVNPNMSQTAVEVEIHPPGTGERLEGLEKAIGAFIAMVEKEEFTDDSYLDVDQTEEYKALRALASEVDARDTVTGSSGVSIARDLYDEAVEFLNLCAKHNADSLPKDILAGMSTFLVKFEETGSRPATPHGAAQPFIAPDVFTGDRQPTDPKDLEYAISDIENMEAGAGRLHHDVSASVVLAAYKALRYAPHGEVWGYADKDGNTVTVKQLERRNGHERAMKLYEDFTIPLYAHPTPEVKP